MCTWVNKWRVEMNHKPHRTSDQSGETGPSEQRTFGHGPGEPSGLALRNDSDQPSQRNTKWGSEYRMTTWVKVWCQI